MHKYDPKPIKHLVYVIYVIQMGWFRWGRKARLAWLGYLREACEQTIVVCDDMIERYENETR